MDKKLFFTLLSVLYVIILLLAASFLKIAEVTKPGADKSLHFIAFFALTLLLVFTFQSYKSRHKFTLSFAVALLIGLFIELLQLGLPSREFSLLDLLADLVGIILALVLAWSFSRQ